MVLILISSWQLLRMHSKQCAKQAASSLLPGTFWVQCIKLSLQGLEGMCHAVILPGEWLWLVLMC